MPALAPIRHALADGDGLLAAARERAHDRRAAADVAAVADHDAGRDATLDHRRAEGAGVEVAEALVHHDRALGEVRAQAHPRAVGDAHARRDDVVDHARELVDAVHVEHLARLLHAQPHVVDLGDRDRAEVRPHHVGEGAEDAVHVDRVRRGEPVGQQVQPEVRIGGRLGRGVDVDRQPDRPHRDVAHRVELVAQAELGVEIGVRLDHVVVAELAPAEPPEPGVERGPVGSDGGEARAPSGTSHWISCSGRIVGNSTTSRMLSTPASSMATRSMPMPRPPVGGMPYSSARR